MILREFRLATKIQIGFCALLLQIVAFATTPLTRPGVAFSSIAPAIGTGSGGVTYTDTMMVVEKYISGLGSYFAFYSGKAKLKVAIDIKAAAIDPTKFDETTPINLVFNNFYFSAMLGDDLKYGNSKKKATFHIWEEGIKNPVTTVTVSWNSKTLTISVTGDVVDFHPCANDYAGDETGPIIDSKSLYIDIGSFHRIVPVSLTGTVVTKPSSDPEQEFVSSKVKITGHGSF